MADEPRKILIIEDSPTMISMYRAALGGEAGTELFIARDGVEGLDRAAQEPDIDLYIVDINMPQMDGLEFLRRLRGELGVEEQPAIVISTESGDADKDAAGRAGATTYLTKPWAPDELLRTVRSVMAPR